MLNITNNNVLCRDGRLFKTFYADWKTIEDKMKLKLKTKFIEGFRLFKSKFEFISCLLACLLPSFTKMKFATPYPFSIMNFDSATDQVADEYLTVAQLAQKYPAFSQGSIRWLIFNAESNGFKKVVRKLGRKVILNLREFRKYLEEQSSK